MKISEVDDGFEVDGEIQSCRSRDAMPNWRPRPGGVCELRQAPLPWFDPWIQLLYAGRGQRERQINLLFMFSVCACILNISVFYPMHLSFRSLNEQASSGEKNVKLLTRTT